MLSNPKCEWDFFDRRKIYFRRDVGGKEAGAGGTEYDYKHRNINNWTHKKKLATKLNLIFV